MKVIISESQYITLKENVKKEKYRTLVFSLLKTLFGELTIKDEYDGRGRTYIHNIYDQHGEDIGGIFMGDHANKGCKKDLTLNQETSERLEGYIPYFRHKVFSKVLIEYIYDKFKIKCDCVQYDYNFERVIRYNDDEDYEYLNYDTRKYNVKKKKKIKESVDKRKKLFIDLLGDDLINSIQKITSAEQLPIELLKSIGSSRIQQYIDVYGPLYYFVFDGEPFIYKDRVTPKGEEYEMFVNPKGTFFDGQMTSRLGLDYTGLKFSDVINTIFNEEEEDTSPLNESVDKNKKFLIDVMGIDFTDKIKMITSTYDVPMEFDEVIGPEYVRRVLNYFGPMYLVNIDGKKYLYQYRTDKEDGDFEWFHDEHGFNYVDGEILEKLGIDIMGLKFSDIIDIFFNEE